MNACAPLNKRLYARRSITPICRGTRRMKRSFLRSEEKPMSGAIDTMKRHILPSRLIFSIARSAYQRGQRLFRNSRQQQQRVLLMKASKKLPERAQALSFITSNTLIFIKRRSTVLKTLAAQAAAAAAAAAGACSISIDVATRFSSFSRDYPRHFPLLAFFRV